MSWHCSAALAEDFSDRDCLDGELCAGWKSIRSVVRLSCDDKRTDAWKHFHFGMMSKPSTLNRGVVSWISSLRGSPANHSVQPGNAKAKKTNETCGRKPSGCYARYDRASHSWKTFLAFVSCGYFNVILGELAEAGFDARWEIVSAAEVGAVHIRKRTLDTCLPQEQTSAELT